MRQILLAILILWSNFACYIAESNENSTDTNKNVQKSSNQIEFHPPDSNQNGKLRCDRNACAVCYEEICLECQYGYVMTNDYYCDIADQINSRTDILSISIAIFNIIFVLLFFHIWILKARKNQNKFLFFGEDEKRLQQELDLLKNKTDDQLQQNQQQPQTIGEDKKTQNVLAINDIEMNKIQKNKINNSYINQTFAQTVNQINLNQSVDERIQLKVVQNNSFCIFKQQQILIQQYLKKQQQKFIIQPAQQNTKNDSADNHEQFYNLITSNLNGYWLTQAGKFSFKNFSNLNRINHLITNFSILQAIMSASILYVGSFVSNDLKDNFYSKYSNLDSKEFDHHHNNKTQWHVLSTFVISLSVYWFITLLFSLFILIIQHIYCQFKTTPYSNQICIGLPIYIVFIASSLFTTYFVCKMSGFEAQLWVIQLLAAILIIVFCDKKAVELVKNYKIQFIYTLIQIRKIDLNN